MLTVAMTRKKYLANQRPGIMEVKNPGEMLNFAIVILAYAILSTGIVLASDSLLHVAKRPLAFGG